MGSRLAANVLSLHYDVSPRARLVLVKMALLAMDKDRPPIYFAGWAPLAMPLGYPAYDGNAERAVARAIRELVDAGFVKPYGAPGPGHNVTYALHLRLM